MIHPDKLAKPLTAAALGAAGFIAGGIMAQDHIDAGAEPNHAGRYTSGVWPACGGFIEQDLKDPITVEFAYANWLELVQHSAHHSWEWSSGDDTGGSRQDFWDHGQCAPNDAQSGWNDGGCRGCPGGGVHERYHMRYRTLSTLDQWGNRIFEADGYTGYTTAAAPHWDEEAGCLFGIHYVPESMLWRNWPTPMSGYDAGRAEVAQLWVTEGAHLSLAAQNWSNTQSMPQCNGERPFSNGIVYVIK